MKRLVLPIFLLLSMLLAGCATQEYVRQQMQPLADRISKIEAANCCEKAEEASQKCENVAKKCEKAFQLHQEK